MPDPISWAFAWPYLLAAAVAGYLLGSIPFGLLLTRLAGLAGASDSGSGSRSRESKESTESHTVNAPLSGTVFKVVVRKGQQVKAGDIVIVLEAMKMETEIRASRPGTVRDINVAEGDSVAVGSALVTLG